MKKVLLEMLGLLGVVGLLAGGTYLLVGPPQRGVVCSEEVLGEGEICLEKVPAEGTLWIDARPRKLWLKNGLPGSLLLTDDRSENWDNLLAEVAAAVVEAQQVVIYCNTKGCGSSEAVAGKLRELELGPPIYVLHGGWRALAVDGEPLGGRVGL